jgi:2-(1,2-epoxy-1,2-dihydrophenyl)acetyl-CoA isomerase
VSVTQSGPVAVVEIHRPPHNYFDAGVVTGVANAITALDQAPECRVVVLA